VTARLSPLKDRLLAEARRLSVPVDVVELDYGLSYVLAAVFSHGGLRDALVFKGGTALHKAYFSDYRFSVDLDFTALGGPRGDALEQIVAEVSRETESLLGEYGPFAVSFTRRPERNAHPAGQEAFLIKVQFPWHRSPLRSIKLEITVDEPLLLAVESRPLLHPYGEPLAVRLGCYRLEEIVAEKLRTPLQAQKRVDEGKWARNCARDYYDLWHLCRLPGDAFERAEVVKILPQKCAARGVVFGGVEDFFPALILSEAERQWETSLADLVRPLPDFGSVVADLRESLPLLLVGR